jgi:hypothetical protein
MTLWNVVNKIQNLFDGNSSYIVIISYTWGHIRQQCEFDLVTRPADWWRDVLGMQGLH